jgi:hypothetical protein
LRYNHAVTRRLFNVLAGASLLMCVALCVSRAWHRGAGLSYAFPLTPAGQKWINFYIGGDGFAMCEDTFSSGSAPYIPVVRGLHSDRDYAQRLIAGGAADEFTTFLNDTQDFSLFVSIWPLILATAVLPFFWLKRRPTTSGLCPQCNYDLRATPERCPECGRLNATMAPGK